MKNLRILLVFAIAASLLYFTSCGPSDTNAPNMYLTGTPDTTVLLGLVYTDPGIVVEDNADQTSEIIVENDIEDVIDVYSTDDRTRRDEDYYIVYTATDQAGNSDTIGRMVRVTNVSEPFANSYECRRTISTIWGDTTYRSRISVDSRVAGRLRISRVYNHWDPNISETSEGDPIGAKVYFKINADLWHPDLSQQASERYAYLGVSTNDNETPFFDNMDYTEATDSILKFVYLRIDEQIMEDSLGNAAFQILGSTEQDGTPKSRIEYVSGEISKIILKYNITNTTSATPPDLVTEEYTLY